MSILKYRFRLLKPKQLGWMPDSDHPVRPSSDVFTMQKRLGKAVLLAVSYAFGLKWAAPAGETGAASVICRAYWATPMAALPSFNFRSSSALRFSGVRSITTFFSLPVNLNGTL